MKNRFLVHTFIRSILIKWNPIRNSSAPQIKSTSVKNTRNMQSQIHIHKHSRTYTDTHTLASIVAHTNPCDAHAWKCNCKKEKRNNITCSDFIVHTATLHLEKWISWCLCARFRHTKDMDTARHIHRKRERERES